MEPKLRVKGTGEPVRNAIIKDGVVHVLRERKYNGCDECTMASMCDNMSLLCTEFDDYTGDAFGFNMSFGIEDVEVVQE